MIEMNNNIKISNNLLKLNNMIKQTVSVLSAIILFAGTTLAQDDLRVRPTFGIKAGVNYSNIWDTEGEDFSADPKAGFAGGVFVTLPLGKLLALQPEIMFSQKGFTASGTVLTMPYEFTRTSNYLDIPLLLAIRPAKFLSIVAGPQIGFQLSQTDKFSAGNFSSEEQKKFENDNWRKNMIGLHLGADINLGKVVVSPRAALDFQDNKGDGTSSDPRYKNFLLQLTLGYRF